jgi:hypothetical protein
MRLEPQDVLMHEVESSGRRGLRPAVVPFHVVLAAFKLTIIGEGNRARARRLGAEPPAAGGIPLAEWALELLDQG